MFDSKRYALMIPFIPNTHNKTLTSWANAIYSQYGFICVYTKYIFYRINQFHSVQRVYPKEIDVHANYLQNIQMNQWKKEVQEIHRHKKKEEEITHSFAVCLHFYSCVLGKYQITIIFSHIGDPT